MLALASRARVMLVAQGAVGFFVSCGADTDPVRWTNADTSRLQAKVSACIGLDVGDSVGFFWPSQLGGIAEGTQAEDCVEAASTCAEVRSCGGYSAFPCAERAHRCEGTTAFNCIQQHDIALEKQSTCAESAFNGSQCLVAANAKGKTRAFCHTGACTNEHCDGDEVVQCVAGVEVRQNCASDGRTCFQAGDVALCAYDMGCTHTTCHGNLLRVCAAGHVIQEANCPSIVPGTRCVQSPESAECAAVWDSAECRSHPTSDSWCEGDSGVTCLFGVRFELNCAALPGGHCASWRIGELADVSRAGCRADGTLDSYASLLIP